MFLHRHPRLRHQRDPLFREPGAHSPACLLQPLRRPGCLRSVFPECVHRTAGLCHRPSDSTRDAPPSMLMRALARLRSEFPQKRAPAQFMCAAASGHIGSPIGSRGPWTRRRRRCFSVRTAPSPGEIQLRNRRSVRRPHASGGLRACRQGGHRCLRRPAPAACGSQMLRAVTGKMESRR